MIISHLALLRGSVDSATHLDISKINIALPDKENRWLAPSSGDWLLLREPGEPEGLLGTFQALLSRKDYCAPTSLGHHALIGMLFNHICLVHALLSSTGNAQAGSEFLAAADSACSRWFHSFNSCDDALDYSARWVREKALTLYKAALAHLHIGNLPLDDQKTKMFEGTRHVDRYDTSSIVLQGKALQVALSFCIEPVKKGLHVLAHTAARDLPVDLCLIGCPIGRQSNSTFRFHLLTPGF
jgi:hypothetical protein